jgi:hypothetical protein
MFSNERCVTVGGTSSFVPVEYVDEEKQMVRVYSTGLFGMVRLPDEYQTEVFW